MNFLMFVGENHSEAFGEALEHEKITEKLFTQWFGHIHEVRRTLVMVLAMTNAKSLQIYMDSRWLSEEHFSKYDEERNNIFFLSLRSDDHAIKVMKAIRAIRDENDAICAVKPYSKIDPDENMIRAIQTIRNIDPMDEKSEEEEVPFIHARINDAMNYINKMDIGEEHINAIWNDVEADRISEMYVGSAQTLMEHPNVTRLMISLDEQRRAESSSIMTRLNLLSTYNTIVRQFRPNNDNRHTEMTRLVSSQS